MTEPTIDWEPIDWKQEAMAAHARIEELERVIADLHSGAEADNAQIAGLWKRITDLEEIMQEAINTLERPLLDPPEDEGR